MTMPIDFGFIQAPADLDKSWRLDIPFPEIESKALINKSASA
jgi:hypothetical protein